MIENPAGILIGINIFSLLKIHTEIHMEKIMWFIGFDSKLFGMGESKWLRLEIDETRLAMIIYEDDDSTYCISLYHGFCFLCMFNIFDNIF